MIRFSLGQVVATPGALEVLEKHELEPVSLLMRHATGDWGTLPPEDAQMNEDAVSSGYRIMSVYPLDAEDKVWIITEWDRSVTTLLLPSEY